MRHLLGDALWWITVHADRLSLSIDRASGLDANWVRLSALCAPVHGQLPRMTGR